MTSELMDPVSTETRTDGRIDRRLRNREAVIEATIKMFIEGEVIPAMDDAPRCRGSDLARARSRAARSAGDD